MMRFSVDRDALLNAVERAARCVSGRTPLPVLKCLLLEAHEDLVVQGTDMSSGIVIHTDAEVAFGGEGSAAVPANLLLELCKRLPAGKVEVEELSTAVQFRSGRTKLKLDSLPGEEFPEVAQPSGMTIELPQGALLRTLRRVSPAAAVTDNARPVMTGILTIGTEDSLVMCATDGRSLGWASQPVATNSAQEFRLVVPARSYAEVARLLDTSDIPVRVRADAGAGAGAFIHFELPRIRIYCRLLEGIFPDFNKVIPKRFLRSFRCSRAELRRCIERMKLVAREQDSPGLMVLDFRTDEVALRANTPQVGDGEDAVPGILEGEPLRIAFNGDLLLDALASLDGDEAELRLQDETHAAVIRSPGDDSSLYVIMPVRLREDLPQ